MTQREFILMPLVVCAGPQCSHKRMDGHHYEMIHDMLKASPDRHTVA